LITFYTWLKQFKNSQNSLGDLSRDALADSSFPRTSKYETILEHLTFSNACDNAIDTFRKSFGNYQRDVFNKKQECDG
jgi:uncharacterized protein YozE (UPF0346 family)